MAPKQSTRAPKLAMILALVLLVATTALAAAQSPDVLLPLITGDGQPQQAVPDTPLEPDPAAPVGDSRDTNSGDYETPAQEASVNAFDATQWTVQNNVGIGTDAPTADIDLSRNVNNYTRIWVRNPNAGANAQSQLYLNTASTNGLVVQQFGSGYTAKWGPLPLANRARLRTTPTVTGLILTTGGPYPLIVGTSDQERMRILSDGRVGIGTTTPTHQLSIARGPQWTSNFWGGSIDLTNGGAIAWRANASGNSFGMGRTDAGFYFFHTLSAPGTTGSAASYDVTIDNNGDLAVYGDATISGILGVNSDTWLYGDLYVDNQKMNVPDYVFEPEYTLMSLNELRTYVAEEKHLPNVPDAEEIAQGGLNVTDFQMKLLEKTEELTLYTLAQDEQIKSLQAENQAMHQTNHAQGEQLETLQQENEALQEMIADLEARLAALEKQE